MSLPNDEPVSTDDVLKWLKANGSNAVIENKARFGIKIEQTFGVTNAALRPYARGIGKDHERALELWKTGYREARLIASYTDEKAKVTEKQARRWAAEFDSWEIVDSVADLFIEAGLSDLLIPEFAADEAEFTRRAAFSMIAVAAVHMKKRPDAEFLGYLDLIEAHATDERNFVKKAVNWALRQVGKRSLELHAPALSLAEKLGASSDKTARWIGKDALRELTNQKIITAISQKDTATKRGGGVQKRS